MTRERYLSRAPIREAVFDLRIPASEVGPEELHGRLRSLDAFERIDEMRGGTATFTFGPGRTPEGSMREGGVVGYRAVSEDGLWVVQFRLNGLTFSRLPPYPDWETFGGRARTYVEALLDVTRPPRVDRVALRFVNHFDLPHPSSLEDYFVGLPAFPDVLPGRVSNLLSRVTVHDPVRDFSAHITHSLLEHLDPEKIGFLLDIDAFQTADLPPSPDRLWETYDALRVFKNEVFFALITDLNAEMHE